MDLSSLDNERQLLGRKYLLTIKRQFTDENVT